MSIAVPCIQPGASTHSRSQKIRQFNRDLRRGSQWRFYRDPWFHTGAHSRRRALGGSLIIRMTYWRTGGARTSRKAK